VNQHIRDFLLGQLAQHIHRLSSNLPVACQIDTSRQAIQALDEKKPGDLLSFCYNEL
jgi:hypothetical protein